MNTNDADDIRPDTSQLDWSKAEIGRWARKPGEKTEIFVDGAVAYLLRLIPSNKVLARDGTTISVSAGPRLARWARYNNGEPNPYENRTVVPARRVAEV